MSRGADADFRRIFYEKVCWMRRERRIFPRLCALKSPVVFWFLPR